MGWEQFLGIVLVGIVFLIFYLASILDDAKHDILKNLLMGAGMWVIYFINIIALKVIQENGYVAASIISLVESLSNILALVALFLSFYFFFFIMYKVYLLWVGSQPDWKRK